MLPRRSSYYSRIFLQNSIFKREKNGAVDSVLVSIEDGLVRGSYKKSFNGRRYMAFEGIPYAKPPIQELRFEDPQPLQPWLGILDASHLHTALQPGIFPGAPDILGQEDCLYLNVYVPGDQINRSEKLAVLFNIHGGAYIIGSPAMLALPPKIMDRDIVYVSINYRLGAFGFLSAGDGRGNYGLKDQTAALKWVQRNIEDFGGDKDCVTLCGLSAGSSCVHAHYLSPMSRGLFHRGYAQSGLPLNPCNLVLNPSKNTKKLARAMACPGGSPEEIRKCLKARPYIEITRWCRSLYHLPLVPLVTFGPIVEEKHPSAFMVQHPRLQLESGHVADVPLLMSMTTEEGAVPISLVYHKLDELNSDWNKWCPLLLSYDQYDQEVRDYMSAKIKEFYFKNKPITRANFHLLVQASTHSVYHLGLERTARLQTKRSCGKVYVLLTNYSGQFAPLNLIGLQQNLGIGHAMDGRFLYSGSLHSTKAMNEEEIRMKDKLLDMLVSFAKTGKPQMEGVDFGPVTKSDLNYLFVQGPDNIKMQSTDHLVPIDFWNNFPF